VNTWQIQEEEFDPQKLHAQETVFTIGNGYFGTRGTFEEGYPKASPATLLFGVFDDIPIGKEELANAPDWLSIKLFVNKERFALDRGKILAYRRTLDMQHGVLRREVHWESLRGTRITVAVERFASLADEHCGAIRYSVTADEQDADSNEKLEIVLRAAFNVAVGNDHLMHFESVDQGHDEHILWLHTQTFHTDVHLAQTMSFITTAHHFQEQMMDSDFAPSIRLYGTLSPGETMTAEKIVTMYTSRDVENPVVAALAHHQELMDIPVHSHPSGLLEDTPTIPAIQPIQAIRDVRRGVFDALLQQHQEAWRRFWEVSDIVIEGDEKAQQAIRYNIYQLRISASHHDSRYSVAAKGLTGFGYHGHIFHDTEIFMLPYYVYVHPAVARNLLLYRYDLLPAAREKARKNGYQGAQFPWESTLDGEEATPDAIIHPESGELIPVLNGKIELHISASIAHAAWHYWYVSGDDDFMRDYGTEILLSTAQFWISRATYNADHRDYEINNVIGPDEWHEHVNNDVYTNYMARWNIETALDTLEWLRKTAPDQVNELLARLGLAHEDFAQWYVVADSMRIPRDQQTKVFEQFDGFFKLPFLDQAAYKGRKASYQALLGMKKVQGYQIVKQADVLMLLTLMRNRFDHETLQANWDYYFPITDHDYGSSLTPAFHVILACKLGLADTAYKMFMIGSEVDLEDLRGNTDEGIHDACAGAVWQAAIFGFAGLALTEDGYTTAPTWPANWTRLAFTFQHKGQTHHVDLRRA
jgi:trehalose/maltose hydrolase-like predicted phosphorylase